jgi:hypothetical protein
MAPAAGEEASTSARPAAVQELPIEGKTVKALTLLSLKRTFDLFAANHGQKAAADEARRAPGCAARPLAGQGSPLQRRAHAGRSRVCLTLQGRERAQPARKDCVQDPRRVPGGEGL